MLIHIGNNDFVGMNKCELLVNLQTVDEDTKKIILAALPKLSDGQEYKSGILTTDGKWLGSTLSTESLANRGVCSPFEGAIYTKPDESEMNL